MFNNDLVTLLVLGCVIIASKLVIKGLQMLSEEKPR
jgi:hypothetical protein